MINENVYDIHVSNRLKSYVIYHLKIKDMVRQAHEIKVFCEDKEIKELYHHSLNENDAELIRKTIYRTLNYLDK